MINPDATVDAPTRVVTTSCVTAPIAAPKICGLTPPIGTTAIATHGSRRASRRGRDFNAVNGGGGRAHGRCVRVEVDLSLWGGANPSMSGSRTSASASAADLFILFPSMASHRRSFVLAAPQGKEAALGLALVLPAGAGSAAALPPGTPGDSRTHEEKTKSSQR